MATTLDVVAHHEEIMGTVMSFHVTAEHEVAHQAIAEACERLHALDAVLSLWREESPASRLRRGELNLADAPEPLLDVLSCCREAVAVSDGYFDPWALPGGLDPTGLAKGWAIEDAAGVVAAHGVTSAVLNGGGDVALVGTPPDGLPWRIGIQHPWRRDALAAVVAVEHAIATSGPYERGAHLIDPRTGAPARVAASATVVGTRLALADALATALAVGGDRVLAAMRQLDGYEAYLIRADGSELATDGLRFL